MRIVVLMAAMVCLSLPAMASPACDAALREAADMTFSELSGQALLETNRAAKLGMSQPPQAVARRVQLEMQALPRAWTTPNFEVVFNNVLRKGCAVGEPVDIAKAFSFAIRQNCDLARAVVDLGDRVVCAMKAPETAASN